MDYEQWEHFYKGILCDFGFSPERDVDAARALESLLPPPEAPLGRLVGLAGKKVLIVGPACNRAEIESIARAPRPSIAADSAVSVFEGSGVVPTAIVTDLDGDLHTIAKLASRGSVVVVHAHGDNIHLLDAAKGFGKGVLGTCQCRPFGSLFNFGGFTDGDRSAFLAERFGASAVELAGFDFEKPVPKPGHDPAVKLRKLKWAKRLLAELSIEVTIRGERLV